MTAPGPAVTSQGAKAANPQPQPTPQAPLPVQIIESPADATHTQEREAKSDQHDAEDLDAQVRAADAAEEQIAPAWIAAILTFFGTLLLIWNLTEARKSNRLAREALGQSEQHSERELRAYVFLKNDSWEISGKVGENGPTLTCAIVNAGKTPAYKFRNWLGISLRDIPLAGTLPNANFSPETTISPGGIFYLNITRSTPLIAEDVTEMKAGKKALYVWGRIEYEDAFGKVRFTNFRCFSTNIFEAPVLFNRGVPGNDAN